jgi:hypothetical protein
MLGYTWGILTTFQRLPISEVGCIGKDKGGFVSVEFFEKKIFY